MTGMGSAVPKNLSAGADVFRASVEGITGEARVVFDKLIEWAEQLASLPNVRLFTNDPGTGRFILLPKIMLDDVVLVAIWNEKRQPSITVYRSVFERLAPNSIRQVERATALRQGNAVWHITPQVLEALKAAYREASGLDSRPVDSP